MRWSTGAAAQELLVCEVEWPPRLVEPLAPESLISLVPREKKVKKSNFSLSSFIYLSGFCDDATYLTLWFPWWDVCMSSPLILTLLYSFDFLSPPHFYAQICSLPSPVSPPALMPTLAFHIPQPYFCYFCFFPPFFPPTLSPHQSIAIRKDYQNVVS